MKSLALLFAFFTALSAALAGADSSEILAEVNLARTQPQRYAEFVAGRSGGQLSDATREAVRFLQKTRALPPLSMSEGMSRAALSHVLDIGRTGGRGHSGSRGGSPWDRMARFGQKIGYAGENISYGVSDARGIVIKLIVDEGTPGRGHRKNIFSSGFRVAGIATGSHATYRTMCVMDFAGGFAEAGSERIAARSSRPMRPYGTM